MQAHGVPIAVPLICFHHVDPNLKMFVFITMDRRWQTKSVGKCLSSSCAKVLR